MVKQALRKIKVAIVVNDLALGGVQRLVIDQLQILDRSLFDMSLVVLRPVEGKANFYGSVPQDIPVFKLDFKSLLDARSWLRLIRVFGTLRPDVVKSSLFFSNTICRVLKPLFGYVCIAAEHNTDHIKSRAQMFLNRLLMRVTYTTVVDSERVAEYLSTTEHIGRDKFTVIYNGVDTEMIVKDVQSLGPQRDAIRMQIGVSPSSRVFLTVSRLVAQKNHKLMLDAFAKVARHVDEVRLLIVGDGALMTELRTRARELGIAGSVVFVGEHSETHRFYIAGDYFILTSRHEGFCIAAMEGLAFGMPLISTRVAGVSEYLRDGRNGFFVGPDPDDVAKKMERVLALSPEERKAFATEARKTAGEYSLERFKAAYEHLLARCVQ
ncbi:MAG: glycosyltransferase [Candidatus Paceibacterota bacterium]